MNRFNDFVELLARLPSHVWTNAVAEGPGWKWMRPLSNAWRFGHFAATFVVLGLNDYQTKGKADVGYWPKVVPLIPRDSDPREPGQLLAILEPFYRGERMAKPKVERLQRFVGSSLCREIWEGDATSIAFDFRRIWLDLGSTMSQQPTKKTIAFAMKCLAFALLMVEERRFDFSAIPVPVDSRIRQVSARLGLSKVDEAGEHRRWQSALDQIRKSNPEVTMVHLDSLLWQIGTLSQQGIRDHLVTLGAGELASRLSPLFGSIVDTADTEGRCGL